MKSLKKVRKKIFNKDVKMIKKLLYIGLAIAIIAMFSIPSMLFADEGDTSETVGVRNQSGQAGQYVLGDTPDTITDDSGAESSTSPEDQLPEFTGDGDTEVFCIDGDKAWDTGTGAYELTDIDVSDELVGESDNEVDGVGIITEVEAVAVEILSTEATGAPDVEDQEVCLDLTGDKDSNKGDEGIKVKTEAALENLAQDYIDNNGGRELAEFLDDENVNELEITVEQDDNMFDLDVSGNAINSGTATAIMENPLVPEVTDKDKNITWYILAGAFNISFSATELVTEIASSDPGAGIEQMTDHVDTSADIDGDDKTIGDHYGMATVLYYYFNWGMTEYPEDTMCVNIFAWVDIDDDDLLDIVDVGANDYINDNVKNNNGRIDSGSDENYVDSTSDNDVVGKFQDEHQVVQVNASGTGPELEDADGDGNVDDIVTAPISISDMDIHVIEGGKVVITKNDLARNGPKYDDGSYKPANEIDGGRNNNNQRFSTMAYTEPYDLDPQFYGTIIFKKDDGGSPLGGAVFSVYEGVDASGNPTGDAVATFTSGDDGYADVSGLEWGTYYIVETTAPSGYVGDSTVYEFTVDGTGVTVISLGNEEGLDIPFHITNTPPPPTPPKPPTDPPPKDPPTTTTTVAGIIEVAGISELPFTGMNPMIPLSGISIVVIGAALLIVSLIRRKRIKKMEA